jgi:hypothetical protein
MGWPAFFDGHGGIHAIVMASKEHHAFLENLFRSDGPRKEAP